MTALRSLRIRLAANWPVIGVLVSFLALGGTGAFFYASKDAVDREARARLAEQRARVTENGKLIRRLNGVVHEQERTIKVLCQRGYVESDLILILTDRFETDLQETPRDSGRATADRRLLEKLTLDQQSLLGPLTERGSPCAAP